MPVNSLPNLSRKLSRVYGRSVRIRGPYLCRDGRKRVDVVAGSYVKSCLLARVRLEVKIGRRLREGETVDHINGDKTLDTYENIQLLSLSENASKAADKLLPLPMNCALCKREFTPTKEQCKPSHHRNKKSGPFCSRRCSGRYGKHVQLTGETKKRKTVRQKKIHGT